jgi:flagellar basal-body rod modification protein FlgD
MTTTPITPAPTTNTGAAGSSSAVPTNPGGELGKNDFLKLMVAQLQSQDPMEPTDDSAYIGQLAQFTQLEQMTNLAQTSSQSATAQEQTQAVALIGHAVSYVDITTGLPQQGTVQSVQVGSSGTTLTVAGVTGVALTSIKEVS